ncbi:helix-turn-helix transcriptional regulator [Falsarthrobacter nasiphocae]|uniref:DNA-binding transcriptional regulator YafY n=1 Tax=Falsarthrobacter nasiphocae TaxID=189863 RepID=A0AAE3YFR2_9MICC|nr:WYL domain-containing protein [Falsarthrobacter nasiphocae]MDR6891103.1 putative DNA-binding transcriptional regulator YafY [Falsarthrobacter nasiphocae]
MNVESEMADDGALARSEPVVERSIALWRALRAAPDGLTWPEIAAAVPGYELTQASRKAFQRDRAGLERAGIRFVPGDFSAPQYVYALEAAGPLPELTRDERAAVSLAASALGRSSAGRQAQRAAERLALTPDELEAAPRRAWSPLLPPDGGLLGLLSSAAVERRAVTLNYVDAAGAATSRTVWPWTVVARGGRWVVIGYDELRAAVRSFRLDRIETLSQAVAAPGGDPVPLEQRASHLSEHALAPGGPRECEVAVRPGAGAWLRAVSVPSPSGPAAAPSEAGASSPAWDRVRVPSRLWEEAVAEILAAGGDAVPLAPAAFVEDVETAAAELERRHTGPAPAAATAPRARRERIRPDAHARVSRALALLRLLDDGTPREVAELADALGKPAETVLEEVLALSLAHGEDAGEEGRVHVSEDGRWATLAGGSGVTVPAPTPEDVLPLLVALRELEGVLGPDHPESEPLAGARLKLLASLGDPELAATLEATSRTEAPDAQVRTVMRALASGGWLTFVYVKADDDARRRTVRPIRLMDAGGRRYLVGDEAAAPGERGTEKHFRLERCHELEVCEAPGTAAGGAATHGETRLPRWGTARTSGPTAVILALAGRARMPDERLDDFDARDRRQLADGVAGTVTLFGDRIVGEVLRSAGDLAVLEPQAARTAVAAAAGRVRRSTGSMRRIM